MKENSHLVEIAWPKAGGLPFYYTRPSEYKLLIFT